jgi:hypothetical protein
MIGQSGDSWKYTTMRIGWRYVAKCYYEGLGWIMEMSPPPRGYRIHEFHEETQRGDGFWSKLRFGYLYSFFRPNLFLGKPISIHASASRKRSYSGSDILTAQGCGMERKEETLASFKR